MNPITPAIDAPAELSNLFDMRDKIVFMPGGYGGIGEAVAWALALAGAHVTVAGRSAEKAQRLAGALSDRGLSADGVALDAESVSSIRDSVGGVADRHGRIDVLVNCVGIQREEPLVEVTEDAFDEVCRVNLKAAMFLAQAVARRQIAAGRGGLVMLIRQHAMELARDGITVNGVAPTFVHTEMIRHVMENPEFRNRLLERIPLGRIADPGDVVGPVMFFCSEASGFVTGQIMYVDGGITASQ